MRFKQRLDSIKFRKNIEDGYKGMKGHMGGRMINGSICY